MTRFLDGWSCAEIADALLVPVQDVEATLRVAIIDASDATENPTPEPDPPPAPEPPKTETKKGKAKR